MESETIDDGEQASTSTTTTKAPKSLDSIEKEIGRLHKEYDEEKLRIQRRNEMRNRQPVYAESNSAASDNNLRIDHEDNEVFFNLNRNRNAV